MEAVLRVFDGIDFQGAIDNFQPPASEKLQSRRSKTVGEPLQLVPQQAPILVLEAMYLKSKSLQKLGRLKGMHNSNDHFVNFCETDKLFYIALLLGNTSCPY